MAATHTTIAARTPWQAAEKPAAATATAPARSTRRARPARQLLGKPTPATFKVPLDKSVRAPAVAFATTKRVRRVCPARLTNARTTLARFRVRLMATANPRTAANSGCVNRNASMAPLAATRANVPRGRARTAFAATRPAARNVRPATSQVPLERARPCWALQLARDNRVTTGLLAARVCVAATQTSARIRPRRRPADRQAARVTYPFPRQLATAKESAPKEARRLANPTAATPRPACATPPAAWMATAPRARNAIPPPASARSPGPRAKTLSRLASPTAKPSHAFRTNAKLGSANSSAARRGNAPQAIRAKAAHAWRRRTAERELAQAAGQTLGVRAAELARARRMATPSPTAGAAAACRGRSGTRAVPLRWHWP